MSRHSAKSSPSIRVNGKASGLLAATICAGVAAAGFLSFAGSPAGAADATWTQKLNASDSFNRSVSTGFGVADQGGVWVSTDTADLSVSSKQGRIVAPAAGNMTVNYLRNVASADELARVNFALPSLPKTDKGEYVTARTRVQEDGSAIAAQVRVAKTGALSVTLQNVTTSGTTVLAGPISVSTQAAAGKALTLELQTTGSDVSARVYPAGTTAPAFQATATSAKVVTAAGSIGLSVYTPTSTTGVPVSITNISGYALTKAAAPAPAPTTSTAPSTPAPAPTTSTAPSTPAPAPTTSSAPTTPAPAPTTSTAPSTPAPAPTSTTPAPAPAPTKPGPSNTGVPAGTQLTIVNGDMTITTPGTVLDGLDIRGYVTVKAANVTIKNSILRSGAAPDHSRCAVMATGTAVTNLLIQDSEIAPTHMNSYQNNVCGGNYTLNRVNSHVGVDTADINGDNVTIENSWLHGTTTFQNDPNHGGGISHNDAIQITSGQNIHIVNNTIEGGSNSALQVTQDGGVTKNVTFSGNWADGGTCSIHLNDKPMTGMTGINITDNTFQNDATIKNCAGVVTSTITLNWTNNNWTTGGATKPVVVS